MKKILMLLILSVGISVVADELNIEQGFYGVPWGSSIKDATATLKKKNYKVELSDAILGGKQLHVKMLEDKLAADLFFYADCFYKFQIMYSLKKSISEKKKEKLYKTLKDIFEKKFSDVNKSEIDYAILDSSSGGRINKGPWSYYFTLRLYVENKKLEAISSKKEEEALKKALALKKQKEEEKLHEQVNEILTGILNPENASNKIGRAN